MPGLTAFMSVLLSHVSHSNRKQRFRRLSYTCLGEQVIFKGEILYCFFTNASYISWCKFICISYKECFINLLFELLYALKVINSHLKLSGIPLQPGPPKFSILYSSNGIKHISPFVQEDIHYVFVTSKMLYMSCFLVYSCPGCITMGGLFKAP